MPAEPCSAPTGRCPGGGWNLFHVRGDGVGPGTWWARAQQLGVAPGRRDGGPEGRPPGGIFPLAVPTPKGEVRPTSRTPSAKPHCRRWTRKAGHFV